MDENAQRPGNVRYLLSEAKVEHVGAQKNAAGYYQERHGPAAPCPPSGIPLLGRSHGALGLASEAPGRVRYGTAAEEPTNPIAFCGRRFNIPLLPYYLVNPGASDDPDAANVIRRAFDAWDAHVPVTFTRTYNRQTAEIEITWVADASWLGSALCGGGYNRNSNGAPSPIGLVAWITGDDLLGAALQEIGHTLGLDHSIEQASVMYPYLTLGRATTVLHPLDVKGIRTRYPKEVHTEAAAVQINLFATWSRRGTDVITVIFPSPARRLAWCQVTMVDSGADFDRDNAWAIDVVAVNGQYTPSAVHGDHWGTLGSKNNVFAGAWVGDAVTQITFRLSVDHPQDIAAFGIGCVVTLE